MGFGNPGSCEAAEADLHALRNSFDWQALGGVLRCGIDIVIFDADGRLARVIGFFGP